jgi:hypothetical protein
VKCLIAVTVATRRWYTPCTERVPRIDVSHYIQVAFPFGDLKLEIDLLKTTGFRERKARTKRPDEEAAMM